MNNILSLILSLILPLSAFGNILHLDTVPSVQNIGHVSTSWNEFKTASPSKNIPLIQAPQASNSGDASLTFPIQLPEARSGHAPSLEISYNSEATNSWLGKGWDITISSFTLDTRWGVPRYSSEVESEIYLFDGQQMGPTFHRAIEYPREEERIFHLRQEVAFQNIIRHGNQPNNYYWEVKDKDGTTHTYGSNNTSRLNTPDGNITEWHLETSRDANGNLITYTYQHRSVENGSMIYPESIRYNGHNDSEGNYLIEFILKPGNRNDVEINCRTGMKRVVGVLLDKIIVSYSGQRIRSYQLNYIEGAFEKTLLQSIAEYDQNQQLFYEYSFEYYDDVRVDNEYVPFGEEVIWSVPDDAVAFSSISGSIEGFDSQPTILGGTKSNSTGGGIAITVGPPFNPACKDNSVGPNGGYVNTTSTGLTALIDIDSDGLPDKLWKEDGKLYYRPNLHTTENPTAGFGIKREILGITDFSKSSTGTWNIGAEVNIASFFGGYSHEEGTTKINTYLSDFNGDDLIDIASNGKVYFNTISDTGIPSFTTQSELTPSPIYSGEALDPELITIDPNAQQELENQFPLHDVVRMWEAPKNGTVSISGDVYLIEDTSPGYTAYETADGVTTMIQYESTELWRQRIEADDFSTYSPNNVNNINVTKGSRIYFRLQSNFDGSYDQVNWDPIIQYQNEDITAVDVNGIPHNIFQASEDFLVSNRSEITIPKDGTISIKGNCQKSILSDTIILAIRGDINIDTILYPSEIINGEMSFNNIQVQANTVISCQINCNSNVDWTKIKWSPLITYDSFDDGSPTLDTDGNPIISIMPAVHHEIIDEIKEYAEPYIAPSDGNLLVEVIAANNLPIGSKYNLAIKTKGKVDSFVTMTTINNNGIDTLSISLDVYEGDTLYADFTYYAGSFISTVVIDSAQISFNNTPIETIVGVAERYQSKDEDFGHLYRGWGQFVYNSSGGFANLPIITDDLEVDTNGIAQDTLLIDEDTPEGDLEGTNLTIDNRFSVMRSDTKGMAWRGSDASIFITDLTMSSSRNGVKYPDASVNITPSGDGLPAYDLITRLRSDGVGAGAQAGPGSLGGGYTAAHSWTVFDITDMNGDRYPDFVTESSIQYTNHRGGMTNTKTNHGSIFDSDCHYAYSEAIGGGVGGSYVGSGAKNSGSTAGTGSNKASRKNKSKTNKGLSKARNAFKSASASIGISGNYTQDNDGAEITFLDINGDGLEDKIKKNGDVALNLGYSFAPVENWSFNNIRDGKAHDYGGGLGFSICNNSIAGGISVSRTENNSELGFMDINGDALLDKVVSIDPYMVRINRGHEFAEPVEWFDKDVFDAGASIGESINGAGTICLEFLFFRICFNVSAFTGQGSSGVHDAFVDIDGDGYSDFLSAKKNDAELKSQSSNIRRTNLLKSINGPLGSKTSLDYAIAGNTQSIPFSKWVLSEVTIYDGLPGDGIDYNTKELKYLNPVYDRHERQFYGFDTVIENQMEASSIARSIITEYSNDNYYTKGLRTSQSIFDADGNLFQVTEDVYELKDVLTGATLPPTVVSSDHAVAYPALSSRTIKYYEGQSTHVLSRTNGYSYDVYGNVTQEIDIDGAGYTRIIDVEYFYDEDHYIINKPKSEKVYVDNRLLRHTQYLIDDRGNRTQIKRKINDFEYAITDMTYDDYGNILTLLKPNNHQDERMSFTNTYDDTEHQYLISEVDGYDYKTKYMYEPLYNQLIEYTDINNNTTKYTVDEKGRPSSITYPYEIANGLPYSIKFSYFNTSAVPYAVAHHYDPEDDSDLNVYQFEDGLHRMVQNKRLAQVAESSSSIANPMMIVSGTDILDHFGRNVEMYQPIVEATNQAATFNPLLENTVRPISTKYDILDRPVQVIEVDTSMTQISYSISPDDTGTNYFSVHTIDALDNSHTAYYNTRGHQVSHRYDSPHGDIWTYYVYDGMGQVTTIIDALGNKTIYTYDILGRRTSVDIPDAGRTELIYDAAGNLTERITATIRDVISSDGSIRYSYDKERLIQIDYPKYFQNKVQIHYGSVQDSFNRVGRIWLQEDATGGREYFFDANGNPTKTIRTVMINRSNVFTYVAENIYDTWGRIKSMKYADGEEVKYSYYPGGQLGSMNGMKAGKPYEYLKSVKYDKYLDHIELAYGNDTEDTYLYDIRRRLKERKLLDATGAILSNEKYHYDKANNVLKRENLVSGNLEMGGSIDEEFTYDNLYRISTATGTWKGDSQQEYNLLFDYDPLNNLTLKSQNHYKDAELQSLSSRTYDYHYDHLNQPTRPSEIGGRDYSYDPNGNLLLSNSNASFQYDQNFFDEENRILGHSNNGYISRYTYDAFGRRTIKSHGESQGVFINGAPAGFVEHKLNYKVNASPYFTAYRNDYRKHYYIDDMRFASKIGTGVFQTNLGTGPELTAGGIDYKNRITQYENSLLDYYASLGVPPGPPTLLALLGQPEINTNSLPDANAANPYNTPPANWPNITPPDPNGPPGPPVFYYDSELTRENVEAGYNFTDGALVTELEQFYYHYDYTGSTQYVTDFNGAPRQYSTYFPSGERWIYQRTSIDSTIYFFNGLELDSESGMYYMGEIYYDPVTNIEHSIDPVLQHFGEHTFMARPEGNFYYDYAEFNRDSHTDFDPEILNSERPDIMLNNSINVIDIKFAEPEMTRDEVFRQEDLGLWSDTTPQETIDRRRNFTFSPTDTDTKSMIQEVNELIEFKDVLPFVDNSQQNSQSSARRFRKFNNTVKQIKKQEKAKKQRIQKRKAGGFKVRFKVR